MNGNAAAVKYSVLLIWKNKRLKEIIGNEVCFSEVDFSYEKDKQILSGITLQAEHGLTAIESESRAVEKVRLLLF